MQKKTIIGGLIVALAAIYPVASNYHGTKLHERIDHQVANINKYLHDTLGLKFAIDAKLEHSGMFSSQYILSIKDADGEVIPLLQQDVVHGPFPLSRLKQGHFAPVSYASTITLIRNDKTEPIFTHTQPSATQTAVPLTIAYTLGYDQKIKGYIDVASFKFDYTDPKTQDVLNANIGTSNTTFTADSSLDSVHVESSSNPISFHLQKDDITLAIGKGTAKLSRDASDKKSQNTATSQIDGFSIKGAGTNIQLDQLLTQASVIHDDKTVDISTQSNYKAIKVNDILFGQLEDGVTYRHLDLNAIQQLGNILGTIFIDSIKKTNPTLPAESQIDKIIEPHILPLSAAAISLFNNAPEIQYGPIALTNAAGKAEVKAVVGLLFPQLNAMSEEERVLSAISNVDVDLSLNSAWASQFLMDIATFLAKENHRPLPTAEDKKALEQWMDDIKWALTSSKLAQSDEAGNIKLSLKAIPEKGKPITTAQTVTYNGENYTVQDFTMVLSERALEAQKRLEERDVENNLKTFMARFDTTN